VLAGPRGARKLETLEEDVKINSVKSPLSLGYIPWTFLSFRVKVLNFLASPSWGPRLNPQVSIWNAPLRTQPEDPGPLSRLIRAWILFTCPSRIARMNLHRYFLSCTIFSKNGLDKSRVWICWLNWNTQIGEYLMNYLLMLIVLSDDDFF